MGYDSYDSQRRSTRAVKMSYATKSREEIFTKRSIETAMDPRGLGIRESRDSDEHPTSLAIIIALDETGSMGSVPHHLVKEGLPHIMEGIMEGGEKHPQVLFLGIGDHKCDQAPLQVSQFESSDELLDKWLTEIYLEGHGGGNNGESYLLAHYVAARHTSIDCWEKRKIKGLLFTIGDESPHLSISHHSLRKIFGDSSEYADCTAQKLLEEAEEMYDVYHIHVRDTGSQGMLQQNIDNWRRLIGDDRLIIVDRHMDVARHIAATVNARKAQQYPGVGSSAEETPETVNDIQMM